MPSSTETLDGVGIAESIRKRELSVVEVVDAALRRIDDLNPALGAFTVTFHDAARASARAADQTIHQGDGADLPPLFGVPISIKDHIWMDGTLSTNGSLAFKDFVPPEECVAVTRLRQAGAIVVGKTNTPEFCSRGFTDNSLYGLTRNPWDLDRTPGGSSGGAGASIAAGMTALALGSDGGGSIRIPAAFCGVVGHKPTFGVVPRKPGANGWGTLSVLGPITRSVRDAAMMLSVMAGPTPADDMTYPVDLPGLRDFSGHNLSGMRIAFSEDLGMLPVDHDVRAVFRKALRVLENLGAKLHQAHPDTPEPASIWKSIALTEGYAAGSPLLEQWRDQMYPGTAEIIEGGQDITASEYVNALHEKAHYTRVWSEFFEEYDLLVTPTMQVTAFPIGVPMPEYVEGRAIDPYLGNWGSIGLPANLTGMPATSVPAGFGDNGLPIGLQFMGPRFADVRTLSAAAAFEQAVPWTTFQPTLG